MEKRSNFRFIQKGWTQMEMYSLKVMDIVILEQLIRDSHEVVVE